ncbi:hypothetical protein D6084_02405, partial [Vibrio parahaemolyticus]|nr:hypothetical protein [Vibrio parahaemolyticus]
EYTQFITFYDEVMNSVHSFKQLYPIRKSDGPNAVLLRITKMRQAVFVERNICATPFGVHN